MMRALYTAASGMTAQELNLNIYSRRILSNSSTAGFRSR